ncbi:uncharacterized protein [Diadema antillarum]|uniref:uncharacterized protein n=1 Tax=Diadema antillarum TaxID=105358 RepID=UPI003A84347B
MRRHSVLSADVVGKAVLVLQKFRGCQMQWRGYSQPSWQWPLGQLDRPRKKDFKDAPSSALVQLEDLDQQSLSVLQDIHDASTASEVIRVLEGCQGRWTEVHVGRALSKLADIHLNDRRSSSTQTHGLVRITTAPVLYDPKFKDLCHEALQQSRHMDNALYVEVLGALQKLHVPLKSSMMYTFLAQAEHRINTFNASELAHFAGVLNHLDQNDPRVSALTTAVSLLTPRHISRLTTLSQVLNIISAVGSTLESVPRGKLANMLLAILAANEERTVDNIIQAVKALHRMEYKLDILLDLACPVLTAQMKDISDEELHVLICALGGLRYADVNFFEAACDRILESLAEWKMHWLIDAVKVYGTLGIEAPLLFDSVIRRVMNGHPGEITLTDFTTLMKTLAEVNHRPPSSWNFPSSSRRIANRLADHVALMSSEDGHHVLTLAVSMAMQNIYPDRLLDVLASRAFANWAMMIRDGKEFKDVIRDIKRLLDFLREGMDETRHRVWTDEMAKLIPTQ